MVRSASQLNPALCRPRTLSRTHVSLPDLTPDEFARVLDEEASGLDPATWETFDRYAVPAFRAVYAFDGVNGRATSPVWIVARDGNTVLGYDEAEEEYGIGTLRADGRVDGWGTFGPRLRWSLVRFPDPAAFTEPRPA
jgi:hypothetical protein